VRDGRQAVDHTLQDWVWLGVSGLALSGATAGTRRSAVARRRCHAAGTGPPVFLLVLDPLLLLLLEPLLLDHEQLLLLLEPLLALVLERLLLVEPLLLLELLLH
ncbi:MAG: hypothetical protein ACK55I_27675, partial [bacterium]